MSPQERFVEAIARFGVTDAQVEKVLKRQIDFNVKGKSYTLNTHGILCCRSRNPDGSTWYSFLSSVDQLFQGANDDHQLASEVSVSRDHIGFAFK